MASLKSESTTAESPNMQIQNFDIDQYLNLDNATGPSPALSPSNLKAFPVSPTPIGAPGHLQQAPKQGFSGPSHQYEQYKQQTGLPVGALANTFALNDPNNFQYSSSSIYQFDSPSDGYFGMNTVEPEFVDFNSVPAQTPSADVDMEYGNMNMNLSNQNFINPAAVTSGQSNPNYTQTTLPGRVWPGMHQQAALAKAQQQAQQQAAIAAQRQRSASAAPSRQASAVNERESEEVVEESISRLLNRMRNSSVASSAGDDGAHGGAGANSHIARLKKDEEDMDEDERLLASEEGKRLSSKERRQLRNKVSARAFRSRRKEYIGQLEGELATKSAEADDLRNKNQELLAENTRLTDLSRMLLASPAFSQFLNDLSGTGVSTSIVQNLTNSRPQSQTPQPQPSQKDANPNQYNLSGSHSGQGSTHIGMTMIPEEPNLEVEEANSRYTSGGNNSNFGLYDAQVYSLAEMSDAPSLESPDFTLLNSKTSHRCTVDHPSPKDEPAPLEQMPVMPPAATDLANPIESEPEKGFENDLDIPTFDESDPAYALYSDSPLPPTSSTSPSAAAAATVAATLDPEDRLFGLIPPEKAMERLDLVIIPISFPSSSSETSNEKGGDANNSSVDPIVIAQFEQSCCEMDFLVSRIGNVTSHL